MGKTRLDFRISGNSEYDSKYNSSNNSKPN